MRDSSFDRDSKVCFKCVDMAINSGALALVCLSVCLSVSECVCVCVCVRAPRFVPAQLGVCANISCRSCSLP